MKLLVVAQFEPVRLVGRVLFQVRFSVKLVTPVTRSWLLYAF